MEPGIVAQRILERQARLVRSSASSSGSVDRNMPPTYLVVTDLSHRDDETEHPTNESIIWEHKFEIADFAVVYLQGRRFDASLREWATDHIGGSAFIEMRERYDLSTSLAARIFGWVPVNYQENDTTNIATEKGSPAAGASDELTGEFRPGTDLHQKQILDQLKAARKFLPSDTVNQLVRRFKFFFEPDDDDEVHVSPSSLKQFLQFLRRDQSLRFPSVFITERRNIKAQWQASDQEIFWIEFEPSGDVIYLAFFPNDKRSDGIERLSAWSTVEDVLIRAKHVGATSWMRE